MKTDSTSAADEQIEGSHPTTPVVHVDKTPSRFVAAYPNAEGFMLVIITIILAILPAIILVIILAIIAVKNNWDAI